ncbi:hypothetical protein L21TH_2358 [Caldisalinibacter kiritimatiensis]|uniref:Uncharacterized protein n=1 Tax=Caldisalinibacter kiritimatiensis TaxID=1304284 RepID=R1AR46_9FIRM|nr:hypothetical protein L21TH_2358 [Caldisalinibacter kiritimatiensis]
MILPNSRRTTSPPLNIKNILNVMDIYSLTLGNINYYLE